MNDTLLKIYNALREPAEELVAYQGVHMFFFLAVILCILLLVRFFRHCSYRTFRAILFVLWLTVFVLEILRQFYFCVRYDATTDVFSYHFQMHTLPMQLCAMQHYMLPAILLLPRGKSCDTALLFMATYSLIGGLTVMLLPATISTTNAFINIQGLIHHGIQCIAGVFIIAHEHAYFEKRIFVRNFILFLFIIGMVLILNEHAHDLSIKYGITAWNLFMLSPYGTGGLDIVKELRGTLTHTEFVIGYVLLLTTVSHLIYAILAFIFKKTDKRYISKWR